MLTQKRKNEKRNALTAGSLPMRVAALMSGSGSNLVHLLENPAHGNVYQVVCILTDNPKSHARKIARKYGIPYEENDIAAFYRQKRLPKSDWNVRPEFDRISVEKLHPYKPDVLAYCGYMSLASPVLVEAFLGVNVHPSDLRILDKNGRRKYVGGHAVRDAIVAGETQLRATTHVVSNEADQGAILMVSEAVPVRLPKKFNPQTASPQALDAVVQNNQERLKEKGDWIVFPRTLKELAEGRFARNIQNQLFFGTQAIPNGVVLGSATGKTGCQ